MKFFMCKFFKENIYEFGIAVVLIILIVSFLDPFMLWMPSNLAMFVLLAALVTFLLFAVFVWQEKARDEREEYHRMLASRVGWLSGASVVMIGLVVQGLQHNIDSWLVYVLLVMVIAKLATHVYVKMKK